MSFLRPIQWYHSQTDPICMAGRYLFGTDCDQDKITWGNPQKWCSDSLPLLNGPLRRTRSLCYQAQTPVWSESSVDEHNLYFARSAIIGYLAVKTWRVKTELVIITILHIIIITTSILNLDFICAKNIGAHNMHKWILKIHTNTCSKIKAKTYCKNRQNSLQK